MAAKSTKPAMSRKPYKGFPLTAHPNGSWSKKHRGRVYYFGPQADWKAALDRFSREWPYIVEGRTPPEETDGADGYCTLRTLCNLFLESRRNRLAAGDLSELTYRDYFRSCKRLIEHFGRDRRVDDLRPIDFERYRAELAAQFGVSTLSSEITRTRVILKFAFDQRLIAAPLNFGQSFDRPSKKQQRRARNAAGPKMFTRDELLKILNALDGEPVDVDGSTVTLRPNVQLRTMTLLGLNGGLGNTDCANLTEEHLDLDNGWLTYPRPKTKIQRRILLWPETVEAIRIVLARRKRPKDPADAGIVFLTHGRERWMRVRKGETADTYHHVNALSQRFAYVLKRLKINGRAGLNFYTLRRQFEIVAGESKDQVAVDAIMGHANDSMAAIYRQGVISNERLRDVANHVRCWLWPDVN